MRRSWLSVVACSCMVALNAAGATDELQRAVILRVPPDYPELARRMRLEGTVLVEVTALPDGSASKVYAGTRCWWVRRSVACGNGAL